MSGRSAHWPVNKVTGRAMIIFRAGTGFILQVPVRAVELGHEVFLLTADECRFIQMRADVSRHGSY